MGKIKNKIKQKLYNLKHFVVQNDVEIFMFLGLFFIVFSSFLVNKILGFYVLGSSFLGLAIFLLKFPKR